MGTRNSGSPASWAVQAPERPGKSDPRTDYRQGFRDLIVQKHPQAHVVLLEPDPAKIPNLRHLWADHPGHQIVKAVWCERTDCPGTHEAFSIAMPDGDLSIAEEAFDARRLNPAAEPTPEHIPCWSLRSIPDLDSINALSFDAGIGSAVTNAAQVRGRRIDRWVIATQDVSPARVDQVRAELLKVGYRNAGRPWGDAGSGLQLIRPDDSRERLNAWTAQTRSQVGEKIVEVRDRLPLGDRFQALVRVSQYPATEGFSFRGNLDPSFGLPLSPVQLSSVESTIHAALAATTELDIDVCEDDPDEVARECQSRLGFFPISFSHPTMTPLGATEYRLSPIIPGFPYSFDNQDDYINHYASCEMAITHRKAGWDCFRHVEIGASGAIPLMPDAEEIPQYAMVHYPKKTLAGIHQHVMQGFKPGSATRAALRSHFLRHQTTRSMAEYIIRNAGASSAERVLFIDEQLPVQADYLSVLTLIGLKQMFANKCDVMYPVDYIYQDSRSQTHNLYGRGFGYTKIVSADHRSPSENPTKAPTGTVIPDPSIYDLVIIGSLYRNQAAFTKLMKNFPVDRIVALYGEDTPPTSKLTRHVRDSGATIFMRPNHYQPQR